MTISIIVLKDVQSAYELSEQLKKASTQINVVTSEKKGLQLRTTE